MLSTAGVGSGFGAKAGLRYLAGLFIGTNLVAFAVVSGLAAAVFSIPHARTVLLSASVAYLLYLAFRIASSGSKIAFIETAKPPGIPGGITLQIINPKAYAVNTALFTGFAFWPESPMGEILVKIAVINVIWIPIHLLWLWAGVSLQKLALPGRTQKFINYAMALAMLAVVGLAAFT